MCRGIKGLCEHNGLHYALSLLLVLVLVLHTQPGRFNGHRESVTVRHVAEVDPKRGRITLSRDKIPGQHLHPSAMRKDDNGISPSRRKGANFLRAPCHQGAWNYIYRRKLRLPLGLGQTCRRRCDDCLDEDRTSSSPP